ncbi:hypothetical protein LSH36_208g01079 [Paralvinella palmiformis]|uniref:Lysophospholipid acyltransferase 7 n=1 Tax=Paralvinella palmiformis TaxID=53620 RepID=A0AAD9JQ96_9ANNE|nr:hypothetical protein LSH36_208g01079 [Paralvinella palmiformis]
MAVTDDMIYGGLLVFSVVLGYFLKRIHGYRKKQYISSAIGVVIGLLVCRVHIFHSLLTATVNAIIIRLWPRYCHVISLVWCLGYIAFFRTTHYLGLPPVPPHCNAVQLILTLKLVGLAHEIHDTHVNEEEAKKNEGDEKISLKNKYQNVNPTVWEMFLYVYCYIGLLTGPYFKYRTYHDMLSEANMDNIDTAGPVLHKIKWVPLYAACFLIGGIFFSIQSVREEEFYEQPFWYRYIFMTPMFFLFRMRFYIAWTLAECMCIIAGLGAYPVLGKNKIGMGPTDYMGLEKAKSMAPEGIAYDFETVRNIDIHGCELSPTIRIGVRSWNTTVQFWLANTIYRRLPFKSGPLNVAITMSVSAYWHGIYSGYYLSFLTVPLCMVAEEIMQAAFRNGKSPRQQIIYDWFAWFFKMRWFDYMCMSFLLLTWQDTIRYWRSVYFSGHVIALLFICIGMYFKTKKTKGVQDHKRQISKNVKEE